MTQSDMDYLLSRLGQAFLAAGNTLVGTGTVSSGPGSNSSSDTSSSTTGNSNGTDSRPEPLVIDNTPALGQVAVIANRAPLRTEPTKDVDINMGRLLEGEKVPLDKISEDKQWYRVDVRAFAGVHTIPDDAFYAWGEASNFEIIALD